jgi:hypothetical protein
MVFEEPSFPFVAFCKHTRFPDFFGPNEHGVTMRARVALCEQAVEEGRLSARRKAIFMKKIKLMMAVLLAAISGYSATLIDVNFEGDTVGARPASPPSGSVTFSPTSANVPGANSITVIGSPANTAGTGNGVELVDNSAVSTRWEYELSRD